MHGVVCWYCLVVVRIYLAIYLSIRYDGTISTTHVASYEVFIAVRGCRSRVCYPACCLVSCKQWLHHAVCIGFILKLNAFKITINGTINVKNTFLYSMKYRR